MFDMYVSMSFGLSIGALTFYCYPKAFGDPALAWEHSNQAYRTCKASWFKFWLVEVIFFLRFGPSVESEGTYGKAKTHDHIHVKHH